MTAAKHRSAWIWLAVTALAIAVAARAQSGIYSARAYTTPVIQFLAAQASGEPEAANAVQRLLDGRSARVGHRGADTGTLAAMLPVFFVGLIAPLNVVSPQSSLHVNAAEAALLPSLFQRPPPQLL